MTDITSVADITNLFIFIIPGFITVWSFRYFTNSRKDGDFEYFGLSVVWGLIILIINELLAKQQAIATLLQNPYSAGSVFVLCGFVFGWFGSLFSKAIWFQKGLQWFKNLHF